MAGDWIKWTKGLTRKPEVISIATRLGLSRRETAAVLMELWEWADETTENGVIEMSRSQRDRCHVDDVTNVTGLSQAMCDVGWLIESDTGIIFPNFERHNGKSAKKRALECERQRLSRAKRDQCHGGSVTKA